MYEEMTKEEGLVLLPKILTVFVSKDPELWANPFQNLEERHHCFFEKSESGMIAYFYLTLKKYKIYFLESLKNSEKFYLSGAFNYMEVCQVRAFGEVSEIVGDKKNQMIDLMNKRLKGEETNDPISYSLSRDEKRDYLIPSSEEGIMYSFKPESYAYHTYERG